MAEHLLCQALLLLTWQDYFCLVFTILLCSLQHAQQSSARMHSHRHTLMTTLYSVDRELRKSPQDKTTTVNSCWRWLKVLKDVKHMKSAAHSACSELWGECDQWGISICSLDQTSGPDITVSYGQHVPCMPRRSYPAPQPCREGFISTLKRRIVVLLLFLKGASPVGLNTLILTHSEH